MENRTAIEGAAAAIASAEALMIGAGAGMGVDSGLPDYRGSQGFWRAHPVLARRNLSYVNVANPRLFQNDPRLAWGFYGDRLEQYRGAIPHEGFHILRRWGERMPGGTFVLTSNVDGQFQKAGFARNRVAECHGSIHHLQCSEPCGDDIWSAEPLRVEVDDDWNALPPLPSCARCAAVARPNILLFGDVHFITARSERQLTAFQRWLGTLTGRRLAVVECGAGTAIPSIRHTCERVSRELDGRLIRINPRDSEVPPGAVSIAMGALSALKMIDNLLPTDDG